MYITGVRILHERFPTDEAYPFNLEIFRKTDSLRFSSPVTFFIGENGTGKSTLLRAIARRCGIHVWRDSPRRRLEVNPYEERLWEFISVDWVNGRVPGSFFGSEIFHDFASLVDEWAADDPGQLKYLGGESLLSCSHGQSLMAFFRARYRLRGLYLLDEPETALSPRTQLELVRLLYENAAGGHAQFIIATHSPILVACPGAVICSFDHVPLVEVAYQDTDHFRGYREFFEAPDDVIREARVQP